MKATKIQEIIYDCLQYIKLPSTLKYTLDQGDDFGIFNKKKLSLQRLIERRKTSGIAIEGTFGDQWNVRQLIDFDFRNMTYTTYKMDASFDVPYWLNGPDERDLPIDKDFRQNLKNYFTKYSEIYRNK